jgi:Bacterial pre-peptidase C-terminal domain
MRLTFAATTLAALAASTVLTLAAPAAAQQPQTYRGTLQQCGNAQRLHLEGGRRYSISATSESFDTVLRIMRPGSDTVLAEDDDSGENNNSLLSFAPTETGDYIACVSSFGTSGAGAYTISVAPMAPLPPPVTAPTRTETMNWNLYEGALAEGDERDGGSRFDDYQIEVPQGHRAMIAADSPVFDTVVKVYRADQRGGEVVATDDDSGGGLNSFLTFAPDQGGTFIVRVTSFSADTGGAYRLRVATSPTPPGPAMTDGEGESPGD